MWLQSRSGTWVNMDKVCSAYVSKYLNNVFCIRMVFGPDDDLLFSTHETELEADLALNEIMPPTA